MKVFLIRSALACRMTYGICHGRVHLILANQCDVGSFVEASIHLNDNHPVNLETTSDLTRQALVMDRKLSRNFESRLDDLIRVSGAGVTQGITNAYELPGLGSHWEYAGSTGDRWITCTFTASRGTPSRSAITTSCVEHFCWMADPLADCQLHTGQRRSTIEFLAIVSSRSFSLTYPRWSTRQPSQSTGTRSVIRYSRSLALMTLQVHLTMRDGKLIVEAVIENHHLRLIPHQVMEPDLPKTLTEGFVHWMDLKSHEIDFRPITSPWEPQKQTMRLYFDRAGLSYMEIGERRLVDPRSDLGKAVLGILEALEEHQHIKITASSSGVEIEVPRFRLDFIIIHDGRLEPKQLGSIMDPDQEIGCLFGLRKKLVFQKLASHPRLSERRVVIPHGEVSISKCGDYSRI